MQEFKLNKRERELLISALLFTANVDIMHDFDLAAEMEMNELADRLWIHTQETNLDSIDNISTTEGPYENPDRMPKLIEKFNLKTK